MSRDQLPVARGERHPCGTHAMNGSRNHVSGDRFAAHPLSVLAVASSVRLDDPRREHERVVMIEVAIAAGRDAARALDRWLSQSLAEYRGSRTSWDLEATTTELRLKLARYDHTLDTTAKRLVELIPELADQAPGPVPAAERDDQQLLGAVAAASGLLRSVMEHVSVERAAAGSPATP